MSTPSPARQAIDTVPDEGCHEECRPAKGEAGHDDDWQGNRDAQNPGSAFAWIAFFRAARLIVHRPEAITMANGRPEVPGPSAKPGGLAVEPRAHLVEATLRAVRTPGTVTLARDLKPSQP